MPRSLETRWNRLANPDFRRMSGERNGGIVMKGRAEEGRENEGRRSALCSKLVGLGSTD